MCSGESCVTPVESHARTTRRDDAKLRRQLLQQQQETVAAAADNDAPCSAEEPAESSASVGRAGGRVTQIAG